ncbi:MAG: hypothetical protein ACRDRJ_14055 [Streptosporangiaceae bacterium]
MRGGAAARAAFAVPAKGSSARSLRAQRRARSRDNRTISLKLARLAPAPRASQPSGQWQFMGVLRPANRWSIPIRSNRAPVAPIACRASRTSLSTGVPGRRC